MSHHSCHQIQGAPPPTDAYDHLSMAIRLHSIRSESRRLWHLLTNEGFVTVVQVNCYIEFVNYWLRDLQ